MSMYDGSDSDEAYVFTKNQGPVDTSRVRNFNKVVKNTFAFNEQVKNSGWAWKGAAEV